MAKILMHMPYPFPQELTSGSRVRPYNMYKAFLELGYEVELIAGDVPTRKKQILDLIHRGNVDDIAFCYSEPRTLPVHPVWDHLLYCFLAKNRVPMGIFYRDAYWKLADWFSCRKVSARFPWLRYRLDLLVFSKTATVIFFPSQTMADLFSLAPPKIPLPPGGQVMAREYYLRPVDEIKTVVYVGGINRRYGLEILLQALDLANKKVALNLDLVCRQDEFMQERPIFANYDGAEWLHVHHLTGKDLEQVYRRSAIAMIPRPRNLYNDLAMPVKLFEYLSYGLPIVATNCTEMAKFISHNKVGLIAEDNAPSLADRILQLVEDKALYNQLKHNVRLTLENGNLWTDRARFVAEQLTALDKRVQGKKPK
ncbi:MAG: glycosyltransferase [Anaerolineales bacterium]|nr:MAG: glycosyltransferase [Anaerolineales bacterium]